MPQCHSGEMNRGIGVGKKAYKSCKKKKKITERIITESECLLRVLLFSYSHNHSVQVKTIINRQVIKDV